MENKLSETKINKDNIMTIIKVATWISVLISITFITLIVLLLIIDYSSYNLTVPFGDGLQFFFQTNGFLGLFFVVWLIVTLILKKGGIIASKIALWGLLIFAVLAASSFVANLYYLPQVASNAILAFFATYVPILCVIVNLIAVLSDWNTQDKKLVNKVIMISTLISVFWTVYYCLQVGADNLQLTTTKYINMWMVISGALTILFISIILYLTSTSRTLFVQSFFGISKREAERTEFVDDIAEENAQLINNEIAVLEKAAQIIDESESAKIDDK